MKELTNLHIQANGKFRTGFLGLGTVVYFQPMYRWSWKAILLKWGHILSLSLASANSFCLLVSLSISFSLLKTLDTSFVWCTVLLVFFGRTVWHMDLSYPNQDQTFSPCRSVGSLQPPLDQQGKPSSVVFQQHCLRMDGRLELLVYF